MKEKTKMAKLELALLVGQESKEWLETLERVVNNLETVAKTLSAQGNTKLNGKAKSIDEDETEGEDDDGEVDDFAPNKKAVAKAVKAFDEDEDDDSEASSAVTLEDDEDDNFTDKPVSKKAKKLTVEDVNTACKKKASDIGGKEGRAQVLTILKKKFKTQSVSELKPEQYAAVISAMS